MSSWLPEHPICVAEGISPMLRGSLRVLHVEDKTIYASKALELFSSTDSGTTFNKIASAPGGLIESYLARTQLTSRVLRTGFHGLTPLDSGDLIASVRGAMLHLSPGDHQFRCAHTISRGSRPLNVCVHPSGRAYFGEYYSNPERSEVHIFGSQSGRRWDVVGSFDPGSIRHIHGIFWDPHRNGMWVLTGDDGEEAGIWWTPDEFRTIEPVVRGNQRARAVTIIPLESGLIVPMDSPDELNFIQHLDTATGKLEPLASVPGSVFHGARSRGLWLLSTAVEKSSVNTDQRPALYASRDGYDWRAIAHFRRDLPLLASTGHLLQWPTLVLPTGHSQLDTIFATGQSLLGAHGKLFTWAASDILEQLARSMQRRSA